MFVFCGKEVIFINPLVPHLVVVCCNDQKNEGQLKSSPRVCQSWQILLQLLADTFFDSYSCLRLSVKAVRFI